MLLSATDEYLCFVDLLLNKILILSPCQVLHIPGTWQGATKQHSACRANSQIVVLNQRPVTNENVELQSSVSHLCL
jgi:hypothetical protein